MNLKVLYDLSVSDWIQAGAVTVSLIIGSISIIQSSKATKLSNKQALFNRRLNIFVLLNDLIKCQSDVNVLIDRNINEFINPDMAMAYLTNCDELQSMMDGFSDTIESHEDHVKIISGKARLCHYGEEAYFIFFNGALLKEYFVVYSDLLSKIYQYKIRMRCNDKHNKEMFSPIPEEKLLKEQQKPHAEIIECYEKLIGISNSIDMDKLKKQVKFR